MRSGLKIKERKGGKGKKKKQPPTLRVFVVRYSSHRGHAAEIRKEEGGLEDLRKLGNEGQFVCTCCC